VASITNDAPDTFVLGDTTVTWTVTDNAGNTATCTQKVTVVDNTNPTISCPTDVVVDANAECTATQVALGTPTAADNCGVASITNDAPDTFVLGDTTVTWTVTDNAGNTATCTQKVTVVDNTNPTISCPTDVVVDANAECTATQVALGTPTAADNCGVASITNDAPDTFVLGDTTVTWTVTDNAGNTATCTQKVTVVDVTAPIIATLPEPTTISCPAMPSFTQATATDNCSSPVSLTWNDITTAGACSSSYTVTRTWTAVDGAGNTATASQTISVEDTTAPTTTTEFAAEINVNCAAIPAKPELVFVDDCSTVPPTVVYTENKVDNTNGSYSLTRKWIVKDACDNTSEFTQVVNVDVTATNVAITEITSYNIDDIPAPIINLFSLLPQGTPTGGTWFSEDSSVTLNGDIVDNNTIEAGSYNFTYTINADACPTIFSLTINVEGGLVLACGTVIVHNAFSPNGDGVNELFTIDNLEDTICYPDNTVEIYNRWGVLVFETTGYNNTTNAFDGTSRGRTTINQSSGLPTGTYFYILNYTSVDSNGQIQTNKKDGYLYLTK
jgi:gliding motility-associated-like protein